MLTFIVKKKHQGVKLPQMMILAYYLALVNIRKFIFQKFPFMESLKYW